MNDAHNTVFLRLEGPLQAWGDSKLVVRRTMEAPTKSGVIGLICSAKGLSRQGAREQLSDLNTLAMGVRIDRPGTRWWDWHTVGAGYGILSAQGVIKKTASTGEHETLISRREYLCDASFLVALHGDEALIKKVAQALQDPKWPLFLGRKCCPPSVPVAWKRDRTREADIDCCNDLKEALAKRDWRPRYKGDMPRDEKGEFLKTIPLDCLIEWQPRNRETAPPEAEIWYDVPVSFEPPVHEARLVLRDHVTVAVADPVQRHTPSPSRPRANYSSSQWTKVIRPERLKLDQGLCVFCKQQASQVHHASYRRAGGDESVEEDLRSLCRLCHDAVTMIEYGMGSGLDRIDPCDPRWRDDIIRTRDEIRRWRSEEGRRRALRGAPERVRREVLEEGD